MQEELKMFEALEWLRNNENPSALATNRFGETVHAIKFVEMLYELGAVKVSVMDIWDEPERIRSEGGPYASSLRVELPHNLEKREEISRTYTEEMKMYEPMESYNDELTPRDKDILDFWWD